MTDIEIIKEYLSDITTKLETISSFMQNRLTVPLLSIDFDLILDEIKSLSGFVNCMIHFGIQTLPELC